MNNEDNNEMDIVERLKELLQVGNISRPKLAALTGVNTERWASVVNRRVSVSLEEILKVADLWPMFRCWLIFGKELPESGQISPTTFDIAQKFLSDTAKHQGEGDFYGETILKHVPSLGWLAGIIIGPELEGGFLQRINTLVDFYKSGRFAKIYDDEMRSNVESINRMERQLSNMKPGKKLSLQDVIAIKWLEFLARSAIKD